MKERLRNEIDTSHDLVPGGRLICLVRERIQDHPLVLEECPFCHKFLAAELLSKEEIDTTEALKEKDAFFKMGITIETGERVADHPEAFSTSRFAYRCKECGKEWAKFSVREIETPGEYIEDGEEK